MQNSVEICFPRPRALYFTAPGGAPFFQPAHALHFTAPGGGKIGTARAIGLQRAESEV
jgi:hypothetical protein